MDIGGGLIELVWIDFEDVELIECLCVIMWLFDGFC